MTENLKQNVSVPLVVELERLPLSLEKIGDLKQGSILQLTKSPSDPVDLVISGRSIGQGELVEVEGKIGVKVLSLFGT